jgi:gliding motility-associatede transport system auxiliary component
MTGRAPLFGLIGLLCLAFGLLGAYLAGNALEHIGPLAVVIALNLLLGLGFLVLFFTTGWEAIPALVGQRQTRYGSGVLLSTAGFVVILSGLGYISLNHKYRIDLTEAGVYGLAPQSQRVLDTLEKDLEMHAFVEGGIDEQIQTLLDSYRYASSKVKYHLVDPDRSPDLVNQFGITTLKSVRIAYGDEHTIVRDPTEESITNGIIRVTRMTRKTVCFVIGHGEPGIDDDEDPRGYAQAKAGLENENYEVKTIMPASDGAVGDECTVVVIAGPDRPLITGEVGLLEDYLKKGGHLLVLLQPRTGETDLVPMLARWGANVGNDVLIDQQLRLFQGPTVGIEPIAASYGQHPITEDFEPDRITVYNLARSVEPAATEDKKGLTAVSLVSTGAQSWAEADVDMLFKENRVSLDKDDRRGPISLAVAVTADLKDMGFEHQGEARLVVFGNSRFADNQYLANPSFYNRDLFLNAIGWLAGQQELVSIRSRTVRASRVQMTPEQNVMLFVSSVLLIPQLLLVAGIAVWWRRRSR